MTSTIARGRVIMHPAHFANPFARATSPATGNKLTRIINGSADRGKSGLSLTTKNRCHKTTMKCPTTIGAMQRSRVRVESAFVWFHRHLLPATGFAVPAEFKFEPIGLKTQYGCWDQT